ncbi:MAG: DUF1287 domain-containing protein [Pyrinomonadaceae bacterium]
MQVKFFLAIFWLAFLFGCTTNMRTAAQQQQAKPILLADNTPPAIKQMLKSAIEQTQITKGYDPNYVVLSYPNGDVPLETGVCSDVVIRAMRAVNVDLQKEVHEDMIANFAVYPKKWDLKKADSNIDHRRVPNLQTFLTRKGKSLAITDKAADYKPGDFVAWDLDGKGMTHIGIVSNLWNDATRRYSIIHNIGRGAETADVLFDWKIIGHYRYF